MLYKGLQLLLPVKDLDGDIVYQKDREGNTLTRKGAEGKDEPIALTVKLALRIALTSTLQGYPEDEKQKYDTYKLADRIYQTDADGEVDLSIEDLQIIKKKVGLTWGIEIVGFIFDVIEGKNKDFKTLSAQ